MPAAEPAANLEFLSAEGQLWRLHEAELSAFEQRALQAEDQSGPRVTPLAQATPPRAADAPTPHTIGTKQVLVIRVDTSDFPGEPVTQIDAQNLLNSTVNSFLQDASYGQTNIVATVTPLYRLPRTGASYAVANDYRTLHSERPPRIRSPITIA
jgi:hypothetical protein